MLDITCVPRIGQYHDYIAMNHREAVLDPTPEATERILRESALPILPDGMNPCGKYWHPSQGEAEFQMTKMVPIRGPEFVLNAYYCFPCDGWHVGHTLKRHQP